MDVPCECELVGPINPQCPHHGELSDGFALLVGAASGGERTAYRLAYEHGFEDGRAGGFAALLVGAAAGALSGAAFALLIVWAI